MSLENPRSPDEKMLVNAEYVSNPENRESVKRAFLEAVEVTLSEFSGQTGDSDFVFNKAEILYQLDPPVLLAKATISSKMIQELCIDWLPSKKQFSAIMLTVREGYRKQGVGTVMTSVMETIAKKLGCKSIKMEAITDSNMDYWRKKSDYTLDETSHSATKII